jgi:hypothetical protein
VRQLNEAQHRALDRIATRDNLARVVGWRDGGPIVDNGIDAVIVGTSGRTRAA